LPRLKFVLRELSTSMKNNKAFQENKGSKEKLPKSPFPSWLAFVLTGPLRRIWTDPEKIITKAGIKKGQVVLEVGCGPGFFTEFIAKKVGPNGKVIAQDVQQSMLRRLEKRMARFSIKENIEPLLANSSKTGLPSESVDLVFAANVFEEIEKEGEMAQTAKELYRVLRAEGILFFGEHQVPASRLKSILTKLEKAGFKQIGPGDNSFFYSALFGKHS